MGSDEMSKRCTVTVATRKAAKGQGHAASSVLLSLSSSQKAAKLAKLCLVALTDKLCICLATNNISPTTMAACCYSPMAMAASSHTT